MSYLVTSEFENIFGVITPYYQSNAGDKTIVRFTVDNAIIVISSDSNPIVYSENPKELILSSGNWLDYGFRVGDSFTAEHYNSSGALAFSTVNTINYINGNIIGITDLDSPNVPVGYSFDTTNKLVIRLASRFHDGLELNVNHILNGITNQATSIIDGEITSITFTGLDSMSIGDSNSGTQVGLKSGQFSIDSMVSYDSNFGNYRRYIIELTVYNSGIYDETLFLGGNCLKLYTAMKFQSIVGEPYSTQNIYYQDDADTGYLDQAFNNSNPVATLEQGIDQIYYNANTIKQIVVDSPSSDMYLSMCYLSVDSDYYKNKPQSQSELTMLLDSHIPLVAGTYSSFINPDGAGYSVSVSSPTIVGTEYTYTITIIPNSQFQDLFDSLEDGNKRFVVWFRAGNVNLKVFDDQLSATAVINGNITPIVTSIFLKHNENVTTGTGVSDTANRTHYTEDDLAHVLRFQLIKGEVYDSMTVQIRARRISDNSTFLLQQSFFDWSNAQISNDGRQLINLSATQTNNLPTTSEKRIAKCELDSTLDTLLAYGIKVYYPFINRWEYWQSLNGVSADFYPDQNNNWFPYSDSSDWRVEVYYLLQGGGLGYEHKSEVIITDYNSGNTTCVFEYYREDGTQVNALIDGELMTVKAIHTTATSMSLDTIWGMMTIEPFEGSPRWISSNVVALDGNVNNPLSELIVSVDGLVTTLECTLDTNKIDLTNGISIGSRIFGTDEKYWLTTDGIDWETTYGEKWLIVD